MNYFIIAQRVIRIHFSVATIKQQNIISYMSLKKVGKL